MEKINKNRIEHLHLTKDLLKVYTYYRLFLSFTLLLLGLFFQKKQLIGYANPQLFLIVTCSYLIINLTNLLLLLRSKFTTNVKQTFLVIIIDILALTLVMHTSGGVASGLGVLIIISVAAGSIFLSGQVSTLLAAIASILIISESFYTTYTWGSTPRGIFSSGVLGLLLFGTSLLFQSLSRKISATTLIAQQQTAQTESLKELNHNIVLRMRTGIMVISANFTIQTINESAIRLLGLFNTINLSDTNIVLPHFLHEPLDAWQKNKYCKLAPIKPYDTSPEFTVHFSYLKSPDRINGDSTPDILIFLDETSEINQQAQQLKLASLGRFTASIAHEIRNPLGAISHAAQLMSESNDLTEGDSRLTHIIQNHCVRMNQIIENILQISRRQPSHLHTIHLQKWIDEFIEEYSATTKEKPVFIQVMPDKPVNITIDPSHLSQILINLFDNGLRYSKAKTGIATLLLNCATDTITGLSSLDVIDEGEGIKEENLPHLFEPFYTTEKTGTGLGLYICRELCEANQARLDYTRTNEDKSCFKISFPHHERSLI